MVELSQFMAVVKFISILKAGVSTIKNFVPAIINYCSRPKLDFDIKNINIVYTKQGTLLHSARPCVILFFKEDSKLNLSSIKINNESMILLFSSDPDFQNIKQGQVNSHTVSNCPIYQFTSDNWLAIVQNTILYDVVKMNGLIIPLYLLKEKSACLFDVKKEPKLFFASSKICLEIEVDRTKYQYGLDREKLLKVVVNFLAFKE